MPRQNRKNAEKENPNLMNNKRTRNIFRNLSNLVGSANLDLYGTDRTSEVDSLNKQFNDIMKTQINDINGGGDSQSFLSKISSNDRKQNAMENIISNQFLGAYGEENSALQSFIHEAYKNRLVEQSDLHEIASQLIELSEAILITRDAIISADVVEGRMSRTLDFDNSDEEDTKDYIPTVEHMETKFKLLEKIKNFIIPKTLEYGEYYAYTIPYSKIFNDFVDKTNRTMDGQRKMYRESTVYDHMMSKEKISDKVITESGKFIPNSRSAENRGKKTLSFAEKVYNEYCTEIEDRNKRKAKTTYEKTLEDMGVDMKESAPDKEAFISDVNSILKNITVCNDSVPLPIFEEGFASLKYMREQYVNESGDSMMTEAPTDKMSRPKKQDKTEDNRFNRVLKDATPDGVIYDNKSNSKNGNNKEPKGEFDYITDCYVKLIDPTKIIPVKIMNYTIGYYYIEVEDTAPLSGALSTTLYYTKFDENTRQHTIVDSLANAIVDSFDKEFLMQNEKFKDLIVEAIQYYNLNNKRLRFQYIPVEYIQVFKIDEDENGNGQSMIKKSLFYAKLYLMLLLFKIMTIVMNSNDMKVNYIKTSGIDKNIANKVQEIARIKQSRQINMYDLFNYTTLINKVGNGSEMYIPTGRSGERPIETEILSGQDVQLNTDLLENLKNSYIMATGVPAAIINYLSEADFAKVVEQNNTKFNGRVINYQLDFNSSITEWYKKIMSYSTQIPEPLINNFTFTLQPPKLTASNAKSEAIQGFQTLADFVVNLLYGENIDEEIQPEVQEFKKLFADEQLPMLNIPNIEELKKKAKLNALDKKLKPKSTNGDSGDDLGFDEDLGDGL